MADRMQYPDDNFLIQTQDMERLVLAPKFLHEIRVLRETKLSHAAALVEKWLGYYTGVDVVLRSRKHYDVCRLQLTQNLRELSSVHAYHPLTQSSDIAAPNV